MRRKTPNSPPPIYGYARVSTAEQGSSRLGLDAQREAIQKYAEQSGLTLIEIRDEVVSTRKERPIFEEVLTLCGQMGYTLAVARLDRLSRDLLTIAQLQKSAVDFVAVDMPGASKFMVQILAAVAENERDMISERTKAALARAKVRLAAEGKRLGPPDPLKNITAAILGRSTAAEEFRAQIRPRIQEMRTARSTFQQIADTFNREGFPTPSGSGTWSPATVYKALQTPHGLNLGPATEAGDVPPANDAWLPLFAGTQAE